MVKNPFILAPYVSKELFCDRKEEMDNILQYLRNGRNITLISPRRLGKTGLIYRVFDEIKTGGAEFDTIYVDISATQSIDDFIKVFAQAVVAALGHRSRIASFFSALGGLRPLLSYDSISGSPELTITYRNEEEKPATLSNILSFLEKNRKPVVVAIDEFQQIREYEGINMEAVLRSHIQKLINVRFIFCGSRKHVMADMFSNAKSPFYASTTPLSLKKLDVEVYTDFISDRFSENGKTIDRDTIRFILDWSRGHTFYTQTLCNECFMISKSRVTMETVYEAINHILLSNVEYFLEIRRLITTQQWALLKAIAKEGRVEHPTASSFLKKHGLSSGASVLKSLNALIEKELVLVSASAGNPVYMVYNVFLSRYLEILA